MMPLRMATETRPHVPQQREHCRFDRSELPQRRAKPRHASNFPSASRHRAALQLHQKQGAVAVFEFPAEEELSHWLEQSRFDLLKRCRRLAIQSKATRA